MLISELVERWPMSSPPSTTCFSFSVSFFLLLPLTSTFEGKFGANYVRPPPPAPQCDTKPYFLRTEKDCVFFLLNVYFVFFLKKEKEKKTKIVYVGKVLFIGTVL